MKYLYLIIFTIIFKLNASAKRINIELIWNSTRTPQLRQSLGAKFDGLGAKVTTVNYPKLRMEKITPLQQEVTRKTLFLDHRSRFAGLTGLKPNTEYAFVIRDDNSESRQFTFKTASKGNDKFSLLLCGDSRNNWQPDKMQIGGNGWNYAVCFERHDIYTNRKAGNWLDDGS